MSEDDIRLQLLSFRILELHQPDLVFGGVEVCGECVSIWPCKTVQLLDSV